MRDKFVQYIQIKIDSDDYYYIFLSFLTINTQMNRNTSDRDGDFTLYPRNSLNSEQGFSNIFPRNSSDSVPMPSIKTQPVQPLIPQANLFRKFREQKIEQIPANEQQSLSQRYNKESLEYAKYLFDDRTRLIIRRISIKAYQNFKEKQEHIFFTFPIEKMLSILAKKLLLNRFQLLFLEYALQQSKWRFDIDTINRNLHAFKSYMSTNQSEQIHQVEKQLEVYLLYCGYYSKKSLNQLPSENIFNQFLKSVCPKFKQYFQQWTTASTVINIKISPKNLNNIFKRLTFYSSRDREEIENYSLIVEQIIDISPAYNADKQATKTRKNKKKKTQNVSQNKSEKIEENQQIIHQQASDNIEFGEMPSLRNKKQTSFMSIADGLDPSAYIAKNNWQH